MLGIAAVMVDNLADLSVLPVFAMEPGTTVESVEPEKTAVQTENEEHSRENTLEAGKTAEDSAGETGGTGAGGASSSFSGRRETETKRNSLRN